MIIERSQIPPRILTASQFHYAGHEYQFEEKKFQEKEDLPFTLLADSDKKVAVAFGVMREKNMYGKKVWGIERTTFLIGPDQKLVHIFPKVTPEGHAEEVLALLKEWNQSHK